MTADTVSAGDHLRGSLIAAARDDGSPMFAAARRIVVRHARQVLADMNRDLAEDGQPPVEWSDDDALDVQFDMEADSGGSAALAIEKGVSDAFLLACGVVFGDIPDRSG